MNLPIAVWMMRSFFLEVPGELLEAASLDGASLWRAVREVILPLVSPGIAATALICVIFAWNEFFFAVNLTAVQAQTMPVFLVGFIAGEGLYWAKLSRRGDHGRAAGDPLRAGSPRTSSCADCRSARSNNTELNFENGK